MSQIETNKIETLIEDLNELEKDTEALIGRSLETLEGQLIIASSFSAEDVVLIHLFSQQYPGIPVLALDTGRLPEETYQVAEVVNKRMNIQLKWAFPDQKDVEQLLKKAGTIWF